MSSAQALATRPIPAELVGLVGEAVAGQGRQHEVERVLCVPTVGSRIGEADDFEELDHRAGPAVRDDQRQRALVARLDVDEVDVEPVDLGLELREGVQLCLGLPPVVLGRPVACELLSVASCTPCEASGTSSLLGQRVAAIRRRSSVSSSGVSMLNVRISVAVLTVLQRSPFVTE